MCKMFYVYSRVLRPLLIEALCKDLIIRCLSNHGGSVEPILGFSLWIMSGWNAVAF